MLFVSSQCLVLDTAPRGNNTFPRDVQTIRSPSTAARWPFIRSKHSQSLVRQIHNSPSAPPAKGWERKGAEGADGCFGSGWMLWERLEALGADGSKCEQM